LRVLSGNHFVSKTVMVEPPLILSPRRDPQLSRLRLPALFVNFDRVRFLDRVRPRCVLLLLLVSLAFSTLRLQRVEFVRIAQSACQFLLDSLRKHQSRDQSLLELNVGSIELVSCLEEARIPFFIALSLRLFRMDFLDSLRTWRKHFISYGASAA